MASIVIATGITAVYWIIGIMADGIVHNGGTQATAHLELLLMLFPKPSDAIIDIILDLLRTIVVFFGSLLALNR